MFHIAADDPFYEQLSLVQGGETANTEQQVKAKIRDRDGHTCQSCGMNLERHLQRFGTDLHVHRLLPGFNYSSEICITLCQECHGKQPKKIEQALFHPHLRFFVLALHFARDRNVWMKLAHLCATENLDPGEVVMDILEKHLDALPVDYQI